MILIVAKYIDVVAQNNARSAISVFFFFFFRLFLVKTKRLCHVIKSSSRVGHSAALLLDI